jgi:extracellular factor (EF) 3-hydroxypalmitic acid methyl ester biosynthesis protein
MDAWSFLNGLTPDQVSWIFENCTERPIENHDTLINSGEIPKSIFIVLSGVFGSFPTADRSEPISTTGPGEFLGELSFLDDDPATNCAIAMEASAVLELPVECVRAKLDEDHHFASRWYHAIALFVFLRLRQLTDRHLASQLVSKESETDDARVWAKLSPTVEQVKSIIRKMDRQASRGNQTRLNLLSRQLQETLTNVMLHSNEFLGDKSALPRALKERVGAQLQREMLPFVMLSESADRWVSKPRGYAGDYFTIELIYRDVPYGVGRVGLILDSFFLTMPPVIAVRNRREVLSKEILATVDEAQKEGRHARVSSLACGPAREIFDVFEQLENKADLLATLIDLDEQAIDFVRNLRNDNHLEEQIRLVNENLIYLARGETNYKLPPQDLIYSIGLIDYFSDQFVVSLIDFAYDSLAPGGRLMLGNFHPDNLGKGLMDYILDWRLIHRSEDDVNALMEASKFRKPCSRILFEEQRINLFAECVRD